MPAYLPPLNGVSQSAALAEACAIAPITRVMLGTLEVRHPRLAEPVRIVADHADLLATLEADAPEDAGVQVEFMRSAYAVSRSDESDESGSPSLKISIDNVAGLVSEALRAGRGSRVPWEITERVFASDDTSGPAILPPLTLVIDGVDSDGTTSVVSASYGDPVNKSIPALTFVPAEYPTL